MAEEIAFENDAISKFEGLVTLTMVGRVEAPKALRGRVWGVGVPLYSGDIGFPENLRYFL